MVFISHFICNSITLNTSSYENRVVDGEEARRAPGAHLHESGALTPMMLGRRWEW